MYGAMFPPSSSIGEVHVNQFNNLRQQGLDGYVVDVREAAELRQTGTIPGAIHIPLGQLAQRAGTLPQEGTAYVLCRSGARSRMGAQILAATGRRAVNLQGGMMTWSALGLPTEPR